MKAMTQTFAAESRDTLWRTFQTFSVTRIVIGFVLLAYMGFNARQGIDVMQQVVSLQSCTSYVVLAVALAALAVYWQKQFELQLLAQITLDIAAISLLYLAAGGANSGLAILYLFPLAGCAILAPLVLALFYASIVALVLLAEGGYQLLNSTPDVSIARAGLYGAAFLAAAFVFNRLAARLIKQENLAARRGRDLRMQEAINRLVISDMDGGILVVGRDSKVFAANPAVERLLGLALPYGHPRYRLTDFPSLAPIAEAFFAWSSGKSDQLVTQSGASNFIVVKPGDDIAALHGAGASRPHELTAHLKLRFATVEAGGLDEDRAVIFLQDVTEIENQAQQLKLASMGRLTASIAHEVRNPLAAISHAASLLAEDIAEPAQARLLAIVGDNAKRLDRMIEDILKLSRKAQPQDKPLALRPFFSEVLGEFHETHAVRPGMIRLGPMDSYRVRFDPLHLREVVVNLLSNALRYASGDDGSIRIQVVAAKAKRLELHVQDDGPPIKPEVRAHLFEPFYTTSSKGTGLGLYLARELCLNNNAMLDYEYRVEASGNGLPGKPTGRFVITFAMSYRP